jgi:heptosyltransferase-3
MEASKRRQSWNRALIIFPGALGDLICAGPTIRVVRSESRQLDLIARPELLRLAEATLGVDGGFSIDRREIAALFADSAPVDSHTDEMFEPYDRIISYFAADHPLYRRNLAAAAKSAIISFHKFRPDSPGHIADAYLADYLQCNDPAVIAQSREFRLTVPEVDEICAREFFARRGIDWDRLILVFPGSGSPQKNWPARKFAALAASLSDAGMEIVFVIGPAENGIKTTLVSSKATIIEGLELPTIAACARLSRMFIGNDSGVSHLAAAAGLPGIVIFGPTDPTRWSPIGDVSIIRHQPLAELEVDTVMAAVRRKATALGLVTESVSAAIRH